MCHRVLGLEEITEIIYARHLILHEESEDQRTKWFAQILATSC